jgi:hypothetical protein
VDEGDADGVVDGVADGVADVGVREGDGVSLDDCWSEPVSDVAAAVGVVPLEPASSPSGSPRSSA